MAVALTASLVPMGTAVAAETHPSHGYTYVTGQTKEWRTVECGDPDGYSWTEEQEFTIYPDWYSGSWQTCGTCQWRIADGVLTVRPANGKSGTLTKEIPWAHLGRAVHETNAYSLGLSCTIVKAVVIEPGVKAVSCANMFSGFCDTTSFDLSGLDTSAVTDMSGMFDECLSLESIDLSKLNTSNVTNMSGMFRACPLLKSVDFSKLNLTKVTDMSYMFGGVYGWDGDNGQIGCSGLTKVTFAKGATKNVRSMEGMFASSGAGTLKFVNLDTSNATTMKRMFYRCTATGLDLSKFSTAKVTDMSEMFLGSTRLESLDLSSFDTSKVTTMWYMFGRHYDWGFTLDNLKSLNISSFRTGNVTNMSGMFSGLIQVKSLDLSHFDTSKVTDMSKMFWQRSRYDSNTHKDYYPSLLASVNVSSFDTSRVTDMSEMFYNCAAIKSLDLSSFDTSRVKNMDYLFYNCAALKKISVGSLFKTSALATTVHYDYSGTTSSFTAKNGYKMFEGCKSLVGAKGTKYSAAHTDQSYARVDAKGKPGYLSPASLAKAKVTAAPRVWSGKKLTPSVTVKLGGRTLKKGTDYKVTWTKASKAKTAKKAGRYTVTVSGVGAYAGKVKASFDVTPAKAAAKKATALGKRSVKVTWSKPSKKKLAQVSGWQVQVALDKKFTKSAKSYTAKKSAASKTVAKLKKGRTYYVHVRAYAKSGKAKVYGPWSKTLKVKVK